ncbi:von Willebrand factor, partial [Caerostris darwini]
EFPGNVDNDTPVISVFPETIEAQYIRIIPTDWKKWISLRLEILGCYHPYEPVVTTPLPDYVLPEMQIPTEPSMEFLCPNSFEPESSLLEDATIQASSSTLEGAPSRLPLDTRGEPGRSGGWVPRVDDLHPHLTIELPEVKWLTSIYIQGREDEENWVKTFRVVGSEDNKKWLPVFGPDGHEIIEGNSDQTGIVSHFFKTPMEVKYIKIIPETWHKWPSFRLELKGCEITEEESTISPITEALKLCPELLDEPDLADNCPVFCPPGMMCNGNECVDPLDCPCVHERVVFPVSDRIVDSSCKQCDCVLGGRSICTEKACPSCAEDERSVLDDDCTCTCKACESNQKMCPTTHECIPKQRWCDGIIDCEDDEVNCIYTSTETTTEVSTIPPEPENATCDVMGKHIRTFDGQDISYEICHHAVMKDIVNGLYKVTLHKDCNAKDDCKHWMELKHMNQNIKVFSDLRVEFNGHSYTASQLPKLRKKSSGNLLIQRVGDQVIIKSHNGGYTVIYDNKGHLKIEVIPTLMNRLGGLCGFYSGDVEDDQKKPDGKRAYTSEEFGDSWTVDENGKDCIPLICPHDIMARALLQCQKLRNEPFKECGKVLSVDLFIEFCMSSTCECMQHKNSSDEKCKCDAFQTYAEACEDKLGPAAAVRNWRFMHECHSECPAGLEWNDCGPSCQLTCDSSSETTLQQCSEKCVPGCFCPPGTVLNEDRCVLPEQCADQLCQGFGDPHFRTFDGDFFVFLAEGTYLIVGDKENDFALFGVSRRCSFFTHNTCLIGLEVVYKGHKVTMKKDREVHIDGISIPMDKLPIHSHGMIVLGYPGATYIVSIPLMSLEARFYEENSGFAVKVPSRRYFNKTEGICGNCNGKKDELEDKPLSEFVCSFQVEGELDECEKSMEELPKLPERIPICERLEDPVFEACHPLVDIDIYIEACSFDAIHSEKDKESFCKTAKEYARQCCQAGLDIEDWPEILGCDITCPEDFAYHQCHEGCPQTCSSVKNTSKDSTCDQLKTDGCFCPDDKILKDGSCVDAVLCDTCDDEGHVAGDKWKEGKCKSCYCRHDLTIECQVEKCPSNPICAIDETLAKIDRESEECCESFACIPKIENCPAPVVPECPKGEAAKIRTTKGLCTEFECECDPALCPPIVWPDLEEGQLTEIVEDSCCQRVRVVCDRSSCSEKPDCPKELELLEIEGECCSTYKCKPREDVCVYINKYEIEDGFQVPLISVDATPSLYKPGDEWEDGLCEKCSCVETKNSQPTAVCTVDGCTPMEESRDYVLQEVKVPGKCCPEIVRKLCKDDDGNVYQVGQQWSDPDDACIKYVCEDRGGGEIEKTKSVINCTECPRTAMYFPPSKILGQCCGICRVTKCEDDDQLYEVGDTWVNPDQPCREAECIKEHDAVKTVYTKKPCPVVPKDCPEDQIIPDEDGCCETCNITSEIRCNSAPMPEKDTVGFFKYGDEDRGGTCVNEQTVPNVLKCSGACHSESYYSLEDGDFKDTCKCCKVNITVDRTIDLICPDGSYIKKTFLQPETCQCSKCAPKSGSETEKVQTKQTFGPWEESQVEDKSDIGTFTNFQREKEKLPFQQLDLDRQVQQEQKDYDTFDRACNSSKKIMMTYLTGWSNEQRSD